MKRFFILSFVLMLFFIVTACKSNQILQENIESDNVKYEKQSNNEENALEEKTNDKKIINNGENTEQTDMPNEEHNKLYTFSGEEQFKETVKTENENATLSGVSEYYVPKYLPKDMELEFINVKDFYVALNYKYTDEQKEESINDECIVFEWYRTLKEGDLEENFIKRSFSPEQYTKYKNYFLIEPAGALRDVSWEEQGLVFHAVVPTSFTNEQIEEFCQAEKVTVN